MNRDTIDSPPAERWTDAGWNQPVEESDLDWLRILAASVLKSAVLDAAGGPSSNRSLSEIREARLFLAGVGDLEPVREFWCRAAQIGVVYVSQYARRKGYGDGPDYTDGLLSNLQDAGHEPPVHVHRHHPLLRQVPDPPDPGARAEAVLVDPASPGPSGGQAECAGNPPQPPQPAPAADQAAGGGAGDAPSSARPVESAA